MSAFQLFMSSYVHVCMHTQARLSCLGAAFESMKTWQHISELLYVETVLALQVCVCGVGVCVARVVGGGGGVMRFVCIVLRNHACGCGM